MAEDSKSTANADLYYFEDILPVELDAIGIRRKDHLRPGIERLQPPPHRDPPKREWGSSPPPHSPNPESKDAGTGTPSRPRSPNPEDIERKLVPPSGDTYTMEGSVDPKAPDNNKMRPQPVPCTVTGLALSGGGIRSAAVCLGALQALYHHRRLASLDYLSTVSGGGYIGSCLSATMTQGRQRFPFGNDVFDNEAIAHLRNYSNYILPRGRSGVQNLTEAGLLILRGLLANALKVIAFAAFFALLLHGFMQSFSDYPFYMTVTYGIGLAVALIIWAVQRSLQPSKSSDTKGWFLSFTPVLLFLLVLAVVLETHPYAISHLYAFVKDPDTAPNTWKWIERSATGLVAFAGGVSTFASAIGHFLKKSERTAGYTTMSLRLLASASVLLAACILPLAIFLGYLYFAAALIHRDLFPDPIGGWSIWTFCFIEFWLVLVSILGLKPNGYSLHRFYRDRLSKAFLFSERVPSPGLAEEDKVKLSQLQQNKGPYHIVNAALNVQGSKEANRRGRNADFFIFTPHFGGSDLTFYAKNTPNNPPDPNTPASRYRGFAATTDLEAMDSQLDLGTALAISGAAVSANMGTNTVQALSPTLALLNIRLGYWLKNPRYLAEQMTRPRLSRWLGSVVSSASYLLAEMLNFLTEKSSILFLTDGGHIENLGIYELLKRGCQTIIVIDAEADPEFAFPSFLKLERYARIDLGIRIVLPWEEIAREARKRAQAIERGQRFNPGGPHCAVGKIYYADGSEGQMLYFKSSVTGDEKDYILDYKRRYPSFPHETTGDQFFSEEQFEMYRALGFHMVDGFFSGEDNFSFVTADQAFPNAVAAFDAIDLTVPVCRCPAC